MAIRTKPRLRMGLLAAPALVLIVAGCGASPYDVQATECSPSQHQALVGRNIGEVRLPPTLRTREINPGAMMTGSTQPGRLTLFLDAKGWITRVACG